MRLVSFDMDGTLIRGTSAAAFMAARLDHVAEATELERLYELGQLTAPHFAETIAHRFLGLSIVEVERHFDEVPLIGGIAETVAALRRLGIPCVISTVSYGFYAGVLMRRFGFDAHCGSVMHELEGVLQGRMHAYCTADDKKCFVENFAAARGIPMAEVAHVGDSISDLPLFAAVGRAVALNATSAARAAAHHAVDTENLMDVLALLGLSAPDPGADGRSSDGR
jgi:phosphoserine phosphatase